MKRILICGFLLVCSTFGAVLAQDARALELLGGLTAQADADPQVLETFDYVLHYTVYSDRTAKAGENYVRFVVDVGQRRLYTHSVVGKTMNNKLIYEDGQATAYDLRSGETFAPPETLVAPFMRWFDQVSYPDIREQDLTRARYLGEERYGDIVLYRDDTRYGGRVEGDVVEVTAALPDFLGTSLGRVPVKLIFDPRGAHIATVYSVEGKEQLVFYNDPSDPVPLSRYLNAHLYKLGAGKPLLEARTRLENLALNKPLDPKLFSPPTAEGSPSGP